MKTPAASNRSTSSRLPEWDLQKTTTGRRSSRPSGMGDGGGKPAIIVDGAGVESAGVGEAIEYLCLSYLAGVGASGASIAAGLQFITRSCGSSNSPFRRRVAWNGA